MKNTGSQVEQDFFFPVERWAESDGEGSDFAVIDLEGYAITADGTELKSEKVDAKGEKPKAGAFQSPTNIGRRFQTAAP